MTGPSMRRAIEKQTAEKLLEMGKVAMMERDATFVGWREFQAVQAE